MEGGATPLPHWLASWLAEALAPLATPLHWPPDPADPRPWLALGLAALLAWLAGRRRAARLAEATEALTAGQAALAERLHAGEAVQTRLAEMLERRLDTGLREMGETLGGAQGRTARALGAIGERLSAIDRAQARIDKLSGDMLGLQDILANKQARGALGEIQLADILSNALPPDAYRLQATLSNGRRADALLHLPDPPGPVAVDAKFPLEAFEALRAATTDGDKTRAARAFRAAIRAHVTAIAERYVIPGETGEGALMFLPAEAIHAELHANFGEVVREAFAARVWIVSPTTMMATLHTMRAILRDTRLREQTGALRREIGLLSSDVGRLLDGAAKLERHVAQAHADLTALTTAAEAIRRRAARLDAADFDDAAEVPALTVLRREEG
jgi:DNA recombination protein RmuC